MTTNTNQDKFDTDLRTFVQASMTADAGPAFMLAKHYPKVCRLLAEFKVKSEAAAQRNEKFNVRDAVLSIYRDTPTGQEQVTELEEIKAVKKAVRSSDQNARLSELQRMDNKVNVQMQRLLYACDGVKALRDNKRLVDFKVREDDKTGAVLSVVIKVRRKEGEIDAQAFTLKALANVTAIDWNDDTPTAEVFTLADKYRATPLANAGNGEAIVPAKVADTVKSIDTAIAGKSMAKDGGITPKAREELSALWARLNGMLTAKQKAKALAAFNEGAQDDTPAADAQDAA